MDLKNINCPNCQSNNIRGNGKTRHGKPRFICRDCGKSFTGGKIGRPTIKDRSLTRQEINKRASTPKIHYQAPGYGEGYSACGVSGARWKALLSCDRDCVTCKSCKKTLVYKNR